VLGDKGDGAIRNGMWAWTPPPWRPKLVAVAVGATTAWR